LTDSRKAKEKSNPINRKSKINWWRLLPSGDQQSMASLQPQILTPGRANADSYWQRGNQKPNKSAFPFICALHLDISFRAGS
jgi:hypothetical protein